MGHHPTGQLSPTRLVSGSLGRSRSAGASRTRTDHMTAGPAGSRPERWNRWSRSNRYTIVAGQAGPVSPMADACIWAAVTFTAVRSPESETLGARAPADPMRTSASAHSDADASLAFLREGDPPDEESDYDPPDEESDDRPRLTSARSLSSPSRAPATNGQDLRWLRCSRRRH